ncbi:hypothetical protein Ae201684P_021097 [Aphanomyces euteiches]|nr:hypothetical protein Ae201684P_021097 [Aphanomyces euteiches]
MHMFERLKLDLLREDAIEEILENTWISTELSLWDYFWLNNSTAKTVAKHLFDQTNGHPRSLFHALVQSKSLEDLLRYEGAFPLQGLNLVKFYDDSVRHKEQVLLLLEAADNNNEKTAANWVSRARLRLEEYTVSQTTLEQIFNNFASQQTQEKGVARGMQVALLPLWEVDASREASMGKLKSPPTIWMLLSSNWWGRLAKNSARCASSTGAYTLWKYTGLPLHWVETTR